MRIRRMVWIVVLLALACGAIPAVGQGQGRIVYIREVEGVDYVVSYTTGQATLIGDGRCSTFSPTLEYVAQYPLQSPDTLTFINLETGMIVAEVPWQTVWGDDLVGRPCFSTGWVDERTLAIPGDGVPQLYYYVDLEGGDVSGPGTARPYDIPFHDSLPLQAPESNVTVFSPSHDQVVYSRCSQAHCENGSHFVIYDLVGEEVIADILDTGYLEFGPPRNPKEFFSWSPSGRYVVHNSLSQEIVIYDLEARTYLDLPCLPENVSNLISRPGGWIWSPDSTQVAFPVTNATALGYESDSGIVLLNLEAQTFTLLGLADDELPRSTDVFGWMPSGESLLIARSDFQMFRLNLNDGTQTFVDDHVVSFLVWYSSS